jgi:hypothetical protein
MGKGGFGIDLRITGYDTLKQALGQFPDSLNAAFKRAATKTGRALAKVAKAKAPSRKKSIRVGNKSFVMYGASGSLKKSIGMKVVKPKRYLGKPVWNAIVGARQGMDFSGWIAYWKPTAQHKAEKNTTVKISPSRYSHLVEKGFVAKIWASNQRRPVPARPFLRPALDGCKQYAEANTKESLDLELAKLVRTGKATPISGVS